MTKLTKKAGQKPGRVTMHDIAREADVALGTVSNVLNGSASVRPHMRDRVNRAIARLGYEPNVFAQALRRNRSDIVGMLIPDITNPFFPAVVRGADDVASKHGLRLVLCNTDDNPEKERTLLRELLQYKPATILVIPATDSSLGALTKDLQTCPLVCIDRRPDNWKGSLITVANEEGGYIATRYLLAMGHRRIACITGPQHLQNSLERLRGYRRAMKEHGMRVSETMVAEGRFDRESGRQAALSLLGRKDAPTAIFAMNDLMALGALQGMREMHLRCPEDISLVGFDNLEFGEFVEPGLTSVVQPGYTLGQRAAEIAIRGLASPDEASASVVLPVELLIRRSVRRCSTTAD